MNLVFLVVVACIYKTATFVSCKPHQFSLPARARVVRGADFSLEDLPLDEESSIAKPGSSIRLQEALRSLLALNDGELKALLMGVPVETVAENLSAQATFLLRASRDRLLKLQTVLNTGESQAEDDFRIAKRRKKSPRRRTNGESDIVKNVKLYGDDLGQDSLLSALSDLMLLLEEKQELLDVNKVINGQALKQDHNYQSRTSQKTHFSYWLRAAECSKSPDGTPRMFCPSPRNNGEWVCIEEADLCDLQSHCPNHEDEDPHSCMFYKGLKSQLDVLVDGLLQISSRRS